VKEVPEGAWNRVINRGRVTYLTRRAVLLGSRPGPEAKGQFRASWEAFKSYGQ